MVGLLCLAFLEELQVRAITSVISIRFACILSALEVGITDSLDLLLEVAVCFLRFGGLAAGLFGIELQREVGSVSRLFKSQKVQVRVR